MELKEYYVCIVFIVVLINSISFVKSVPSWDPDENICVIQCAQDGGTQHHWEQYLCQNTSVCEIGVTCDWYPVPPIYSCEQEACGAPSVCDEQAPNYGSGACYSDYNPPTCTMTGQSYFPDCCNYDCQVTEDTDYCRSSLYAPDCTGDVHCEGVRPGTNDCSSDCRYTKPRPVLKPYLIDNISVGVIMVQGPGDDWNAIDSWYGLTKKDKVINEISSGLDWLSDQEPRADVAFFTDFNVVSIGINPLGCHDRSNNPCTCRTSDCISYTFNEWAFLALHNLGGYGPDLWSGITQYFNYMNQSNNNVIKWAYVIFIVLGDKFPNGFYSYRIPGEPVIAMTYELDGQKPENIDAVTIHETAHVFGAVDEYCMSRCCSCGDKWGYYDVPNIQCEAGCPEGSCMGGEPGCNDCGYCSWGNPCTQLSDCRSYEYCSSISRCKQFCIMNYLNFNIDPVSRAQLGWNFDGDINLDCNVDNSDFNMLKSRFGCTSIQCPAGWIPMTDLNKDGIVDIFDLVMMAKHYLSSPNGC